MRTVSFRLRRVFADYKNCAKFFALHCFEHLGQVPAICWWDNTIPFLIKFFAGNIVFDVLETRQLVWQRSHVATTLHIVLTTKRAETSTWSTNMTAKECQIDQRENVVNSVVMFSNAESPAELCTSGFGKSVG